MELVIASTNIHKVREIRALLKPLKLDILSLHDFPEYIPPEETGDTFKENATIKAESAAKALGRFVLSDDSGLIVPSLNGLPGVHSRRFAGEDATDRENCLKLLNAMKNLQESSRFAYFECVIAIASPEGDTKLFQGICEGTITESARGRNGFSYDPLFQKHEYSKTFAELDEDVKSRISHRRKAFDKALLFLETIKEHAILD
jgi:XTP/dITP diphosphohydrolase